METLSVDRQDSVGIITWHHQEQNPLSTPFLDDILQTLDELALDESVRSVVVTSGCEKFFCSGIDLAWMAEKNKKGKEHIKTFMETMNRFLIATVRFPKPLIAAVNGHLVGAGVLVAACMDFRLMQKDRGLIRLPAVNIDMIFWPGMMAILKDVMTDSGLRFLALTGDRFTGQQAIDFGLIDKVFPGDRLLPEAFELAARLGKAKTDTYAAIKREMRREVIETMEQLDPLEIKNFLSRH